MQNQLTQFDGLWDSFVTTIRGALRTAAQTNSLDYDTAQAILVREAMCWQGDYEPEGRWVNSLLKEDEPKGTLVRKILVQDMTFHKQDEKKAGYGPLGVGALGAGALGYGVAALTHMGTVATIATTAASAAVGGVVGGRMMAKNKMTAQDGLINGYIEQLDTYYHSVVGALNS